MSLYVQGHTGPVPLPAKTAYAWQRGLGQNRGAAFHKANHEWANDRFSAEREDPANAMVFPHLSDIDALLKSDFVAYAERLWLSILPLCREQTP
jgi:exonuclease V gamma subunit